MERKDIKIIEGNLFDSKADIIIHQCNDAGVMGSGIALELKIRYPHVFKSYRKDYLNGKLKLGYVNFTNATDHQVIANMISQNFDSSTGCFTKYAALQECLNCVKSYAESHFENPTIALPYYMSCVRGGGNWDTVLRMVTDTFANFNVEIWRLDRG